MAVADSQLLAKSRSRYLTLAFSCVLLGGWLLTWTLARAAAPTTSAQISRWVVYAGALPSLLVLLGASLVAARYARLASEGDPHAAYAGWRLGRFVYGLFGITVSLLILLGIGEIAADSQVSPAQIIGLLGAAIWGGWFLTVMRDQINLFGQATRDPDGDTAGVADLAPSEDQSGS